MVNRLLCHKGLEAHVHITLHSSNLFATAYNNYPFYPIKYTCEASVNLHKYVGGSLVSFSHDSVWPLFLGGVFVTATVVVGHSYNVCY